MYETDPSLIASFDVQTDWVLATVGSDDERIPRHFQVSFLGYLPAVLMTPPCWAEADMSEFVLHTTSNWQKGDSYLLTTAFDPFFLDSPRKNRSNSALLNIPLGLSVTLSAKAL